MSPNSSWKYWISSTLPSNQPLDVLTSYLSQAHGILMASRLWACGPFSFIFSWDNAHALISCRLAFSGTSPKSTLTALVFQGSCCEVTLLGWHIWQMHIFSQLQWLSPWHSYQKHWFSFIGLAYWCLVSNTLSLQCSSCTWFGHCYLWSYRWLQDDE